MVFFCPFWLQTGSYLITPATPSVEGGGEAEESAGTRSFLGQLVPSGDGITLYADTDTACTALHCD